ncbi:hypothetical protein [Roseivirga sp. UBA1976]|uniref:hypothetical protein n=1 Tax=Roseivirga sp. UBA1976 TaxID=1947386 RepID=UPI00257F2F65|nr:hypothetical protein [Roseivirga sp. UBA1976]|tara:strand:+ start:16936 stop:17301 length:366 start_codon:yes stop_codon:yes gene_type:complete
MRNLFVLYLALMLGTSCSRTSQDQDLLNKAYQKQQEVIVLIGSLKEKLKAVNYAEKDSLLQVVHNLEETLFEIPGYSLKLPGHEGHSHNHTPLNLSHKEIYQVQVEMYNQLNHIEQLVTIR